MYKIIFSDIDRTLTIKKEVSKENIDAIKKWVAMGNMFVLVSGRVIPYTKAISKNICASNYIICNNGAVVYDYLNEKVIYENKIAKETLIKMYDIANKYNARCIFGGIKKVYTNKLKYPKDEEEITKITSDIYNENPIAQMTISHQEKEIIKKIIKEIEVLDEVYILNRHRSLYDNTFNDGGSIWVDIAPVNIDKGNAVKKLLEYLNINLNESIRIGDDLNDLPMFLNEGLNVAVENAVDILKQKADYITLSCEDNGVGKLINKVIDNHI